VTAAELAALTLEDLSGDECKVLLGWYHPVFTMSQLWHARAHVLDGKASAALDRYIAASKACGRADDAADKVIRNSRKPKPVEDAIIKSRKARASRDAAWNAYQRLSKAANAARDNAGAWSDRERRA
jgi:hypothetical protein